MWRHGICWRVIASERWRAAVRGPFPTSIGRGPLLRSDHRAHLYAGWVKLVGTLAAALLAASPLLGGCASDPTCGDVGSLQRKLDGMSPDDPDYNSVNEDLNRAEADCNA